MNGRYAPGGDIYNEVAGQYGTDGANRVWQAHETGRAGAVADVLADLKKIPVRDDSTGSIFWRQITTDPLAAPLASANRGLGNILGSAIKGLFANPWVLLVVVVVVGIYLWPILRPVLSKRPS